MKGMVYSQVFLAVVQAPNSTSTVVMRNFEKSDSIEKGAEIHYFGNLPQGWEN